MVGNKLLCIPGLWKLAVCAYIYIYTHTRLAYSKSEELQINSVLREED